MENTPKTYQRINVSTYQHINIPTILTLLLLVTASVGAQSQTIDADDEFRQYVSWGVFAGPNVMGYRMSANGTEYAPDRTQAGLGVDMGILLEYHINRQWSLILNASGNIERVNLIRSDSTDHLTTYGMDMDVAAAYRMPLKNGTLLFAAGPYTHFVFASTVNGDGATPNPYTRIIATDPHTGEASFAMNDFNAGIMIATGYEFANHLQIILNFKWGVTDLLNYDSHDLYTKPYKIGLQLCYSFQ